MKRLQTIFVRLSAIMLLVVAMTASASALDLDAARAKGLAGEVDNGLLAVPPGASNEAEPVIAAINNQRRQSMPKLPPRTISGFKLSEP